MQKNIDKYMKIIDQIENVRSKNNINWMDILRIAYKHSPQDAKKVIKKINSSDVRINNLLKKLSK